MIQTAIHKELRKVIFEFYNYSPFITPAHVVSIR